MGEKERELQQSVQNREQNFFKGTDGETWNQREEELLARWCDALFAHQIREMPQKAFHGGILCPACGRIHGRCADAVYPMLYMAEKTGESRYLESAKLLFEWSDNMVQPDGRYINDFDKEWAGITVFAAIGLMESLRDFGGLLDEQTTERITERVRNAVNYLYVHIMEFSGNINYPVTAAYLFALAGNLFGEEAFHKKARELAHWSLDYITPDGLFYGEGLSRCSLTKKKCRPVDLGYNVEESLPSLLHYAVMELDEEVYEKTVECMKTHMYFMLPDGAWNNSWGTRNNKWAYWGSRTSDGCESGWALAADREPRFLEVIRRNLELLESCTGKDGLLFGGAMYEDAGVPACVHHTFCHAKALAVMLNQEEYRKAKMAWRERVLPAETMDGLRFFRSIRVWMARKNGFLGTISDYDMVYSKEGHAHGGSLTMLWNDRAGVLFAGTMTKYEIVEHGNMQLAPDMGEIALTPRLQFEKDGMWYRSCNDVSASVKSEETEGEICVTAEETMRNKDQEGEETCRVRYVWKNEGFCMEAESLTRDALWYLPVVASSKDRFHKVTDCEWIMERENGVRVKLTADHAFDVPERRTFNPVGGFQAAVIVIPLGRREKGEFRVCVEE